MPFRLSVAALALTLPAAAATVPAGSTAAVPTSATPTSAVVSPASAVTAVTAATALHLAARPDRGKHADKHADKAARKAAKKAAKAERKAERKAAEEAAESARHDDEHDEHDDDRDDDRDDRDDRLPPVVTTPTAPPTVPPTVPAVGVPTVGLPSNGQTSGSANPGVRDPFVVATFNALGAHHTDGRHASRKGYAHSTTRIRKALGRLERHGVDVVGLQEFEGPQIGELLAASAGRWAVHTQGANAVAWRTSKFELITSTTLTVPYLGGTPTPMPVVQLRSKVSGQELVFLSVHNPADARGPAQKWRNIAVNKQLRYLRSLRSTAAPLPLFLLGDMNDRERFFCRITRTGDMLSASGGSNSGGTCVHPEFRGIDWITGSTGITFSDFRVDTGAVSRRLSDHPIVIAKAG